MNVEPELKILHVTPSGDSLVAQDFPLEGLCFTVRLDDAAVSPRSALGVVSERQIILRWVTMPSPWKRNTHRYVR